MSDRAKQFSLIATAERHLSDAAESVFSPIIRAMKTEAGLWITEVRVTFDPASDSGGSIANCTIVGAHAAVPVARHETKHASDATRAPGADLSAGQE